MFHKSNLGGFGEGLQADMNGYVPEADDGPWDFAVDHTSATHDAAGALTEYGRWWEDEGFPEWQAEAVRAAKRSVEAIEEWQDEHA